MAALLRYLFPLVGYFCTATVITAALGVGYLRYRGQIDDEKVFRIIATIHDVDLDKVEESAEATQSEVPPEEASFEDQQQVQHVATLQFEAKHKQLTDLLDDFDFQLDNLDVKTARYENLRTEVESYLKERNDQSQVAAVQAVVRQWEVLTPRTQTKPLVEQMVKEGKIDTVIQVLGAMKKRPRDSLLRAFDEPEDVDLLYELEKHMLDNDPTTEFIRQQVDALESLKNQDN